MKGFIVYPTYRIINSKPYVCLFGKLENGQTFVSFNHFRPYFYIKKTDLKKAKKLENFEYEKINFKNFEGQEVIKIILNVPKEVPKIREAFESKNIECYEADIRFVYRYLIDNNIKGAIEIEGDYESNEEIDRVYKDSKIKPSKFIPKLKLLSLDIETDIKGREIYCIGLYSKDYKKVIINSKKKIKNAISCNSEEEVLIRFYDEFKKIDPDIVTGWNLIDFDLRVIRNRFKKYGLPFTFGRDNTQSRLKIFSDFFRASVATFTGRMVLDGIELLKSSFIRLNSYKLDNAAEIYLGEKKLLQFKDKASEITELFKKNPKTLAEYNQKDAELAYRILIKTKALDLTMQRSLLTGMPMNRVSATIATLDQLYLMEARQKKVVAPSRNFMTKDKKAKGGFVMEPKPGIHDYIIVLDFKSLYPSIIRTFNIDPASYSPKCQGKVIKAPNGACFKNEDGILPSIIQKLWAARDLAKKEGNELARYAIKIHMNSFYGALANPHCRFFSLDITNAITHFGQHLIKKTAEEIKKLGYDVIYADTDSNFIVTKAKNLKSADKIGLELEKEINDFYAMHIKKKYNRKSFLHIEYEKCYSKFLMPRIRGKSTGAKKRYAGLLNINGKEKIDVTGLEIVRSDWTELAKKFQMELLELVFHGKDVKKYIYKFAKNVLKGKYDKLLVYRKSIRKSLAEYIKITPPHVKAARKLKHLEGNVIKYIITTDGPEPLQEIKHPIDYQHYINKQLKPIADSILTFFDTDFEEVTKNSKQTSLLKFQQKLFK
ncbi:MAG: DNA polymerase II [Nanoarchaeota archaeon]|nr:DNA polymerase II [Nanoarchaeota archaeon]